ncbi:MAG: ATP-binding protein [Xanthobacteraceae bacterium]
MHGLPDNSAESGDRFFKELADYAPVMIWRAGTDKLCDWFNKPWMDFVGRTMEHELGNGWAEGVHKDDFDRCLNIYTTAFDARERFSMIYRLRRHDGTYRQILDNGAPYYRGGKFAGYFGSCIDVTEQLDIEAQLREAQKMDAVGKLTGGVAHDFNNLLQIIGGNLQMLLKDVAGNERAEARLRNALIGVSRGTKLTSQLLAFGRRQSLAPKVVNLGRLIRGMDDMLRRALGEAIDVETITSGGLWNTFVDQMQVETALLNLAINARDAMQARGKLTIEAGNASLDDKYAARHADVMPGQYVMVAVTDTGTGIAPDMLEKVFEPFFTTKSEGRGIGLGLSMVHGFVKQSCGHVKIYSELGQGTTVRIYLPRCRQAEDVLTEVETGSVKGGSERILIVEDDEEVRATAADMLSDLGYSVLKAKDADAALAIIETGIAIDVLFTDVVMPGRLQSSELARKAQQRMPSIAVLFASGYTENSIVHGDRLDGGVELQNKPYTRDELARKLRQILRKPNSD